MASPIRTDLSGSIHHVIIQGRNREKLFPWDFYFAEYLDLLNRHSMDEGCVVHAYALMSNHAHFLMSPLKDGAIARTMCLVNGAYSRWINRLEMTSGKRFSERYWSAQIKDENAIATVMMYIELNPLRADLAIDPSAYLWSSCGFHTHHRSTKLILPHPWYLGLGSSTRARCRKYKALLKDRIGRIWEPQVPRRSRGNLGI